MSRHWPAAFLILTLTCGLAACSSGSNAGSGIIGTPVIHLPSSGSTSSATLAIVGATSAQFSVSATGFAGGFAASSSNTAVATVAPSDAQIASLQRRGEDVASGSETFTVTAHADGTATITVTDAAEGSASFLVVVTGIAPTPSSSPSSTPTSAPSPTPMAVPNVVSLTSVGQTQSVTVGEPGYTGVFTATSANTAIATVSPPSASSAFTITAITSGTTTITFADANESTATVSVTVTITSGTISSKGRT